jgi:hypothetical protein
MARTSAIALVAEKALAGAEAGAGRGGVVPMIANIPAPISAISNAPQCRIWLPPR